MTEITDFKREGDAFMKAGNLAQAEQSYRRAVARDPGDARSTFMLGYALRELQQTVEASAQLNAALAIDPGLVDAHYVLGSIHQAEARMEEAIAHFQKVTELDPANPFVYRDLCSAYVQTGQIDSASSLVAKGLALHPRADLYLLAGNLRVEERRPEEAIEFYRKAISHEPGLAEAHYNCGLALQGLGRSSEALACYEAAAGIRPDYFVALAARAKLLRELGRSVEALAGYDSLIKLRPDSAEYHFERGSLLLALNRPAEAVSSFDQVTALAPGLASSYSNKAIALKALDRLEEALASADQALKIAPDFTTAQISRVTLLLELGRHAVALEACERALQDKPDEPGLLNCRGIAMQELRRPADALSSYDAALRIKPDYPPALTNRSTTLLSLNRFEESLSDLDRAQQLAPKLAEIYYVRGNVLQELTRHEEALSAFARALDIRPDFEEAHLNEGISRLSLGDFALGWKKYEHRWKCPAWRISEGRRATRAFGSPLWLGQQVLDCKTILLHAEQGIGDTIQFSRYATHLSRDGARVLLEVQPPLKELMRDLQGVSGIYAEGERVPEYDFHCPLLSLPFACRTRVDSIPSPGPYLGTSARHRAKVDQWSKRLGPRTRKRVGIAWSGNASHRNDANRSISFSQIASVVRDDLEFCSLQNELRHADREAASQRPDIRFFGEELTDFAETAGLIGNMDLVICVDTSIAHLAGALGGPVWLLLPANPDFRWLVGREDSPWYESVRLIRQVRFGNWDIEMSTVKRKLDLLPRRAEPYQKKPSSGK